MAQLERVDIGRRRLLSWKRRSLAGYGGTIRKGGHWLEKVSQLERWEYWLTPVISLLRG